MTTTRTSIVTRSEDPMKQDMTDTAISRKLSLAMSENPRKGHPGESLLELVTDALTAQGWLWTHFRPAMTARGYRTPLMGSAGFPDIVAVRPPRLLFIELKTQRAELGDAQLVWMGNLSAVERASEEFFPSGHHQVQCYLWRPADWMDGTILEVLA